MTCIAYCPKAKALGSDTMLPLGDTRLYGPKLYRLPDGSVFGAAGSAGRIEEIVAWLRDGGRAPKFTGVNGLQLMPDGRLFLYALASARIELDAREPAGVGTGKDAALGVLRTGGTLEQAVRAAIAVDTGCGGEVSVMALSG